MNIFIIVLDQILVKIKPLIPCLVVASLYGCGFNNRDMTWIGEAMLGENASFVNISDKVMGWNCSPKIIIQPGVDSKIIEQTLAEINAIATTSFQLGFADELASPKEGCGNIYIFTSKTKGQGFDAFTTEMYISYFTEKDLKWGLEYTGQKIELDIAYSPHFPCRTIFPMDKNRILNSAERVRPRFAIILASGDLTGDERLGCYREELAHALFVIPDRPTKDGSESIFNSNMHENATNSYTKKDRQLMKFIASNPNVVGMSRVELDAYINLLLKN